MVKDQISALDEVELICQLLHGDEYPVLAFEKWGHPAIDVLADTGICSHVACREVDWKPEWDDYDDDICKVVQWLDSLQK